MFESFSFHETITSFMILFAIIDIIGSVPVIIDLRRRFGKIESEKATIVSAIIMLTFLFMGDKMLEFIGLDVYTFAIVGAFIIFIIALEMILGIEIHKQDEMTSASIIPIAFPLVAGAGTLTTSLSLRAEFHVINIVIAILLNALVVYLVLKSSDFLSKIIKGGALMVLKKVFGIILLAISIKMFLGNLLKLINSFGI
ncbi:MAG: MarC family protein [Flavobacteriaceae bacterium]|nr:MarC family protein [Flavobacteriaceae bacterium]